MKRAIHVLAVLAVFVPYAFGQAVASQSNDPAALLRQYVPNQYQPLGDYVPCMFDDDEALAMRSLPSARKPILDEEGARSFIRLAQSDILSKYGNADITKDPPEANTIYNDLPKNPSLYENMTIYKAINTFASASKNDKLSDSDIQTLVSTLKSQLGIGDAQRPSNVSCSFSIMPWDEAKTYFGRMVADKYVAIQVNIRNLDKQNEFLLHDIQVAVDTGLDANSFGRFEAGRDKMIVRGVAQRGESDDRRNRTMNILSTIGSLAGGASGSLIQTVGGASAGANWLSTSVAVFQGPLLSGLNKAWPDRTIANVNDVSDMAFSASSAMKTVVPTQGSVPLVTFIPQKPLGQIPFARCGKKDKMFKKKDGDYSPGGPTCDLIVGNKYLINPAEFPDSLKFESWAPAALNILKHRTFVVVAGIHIQEVSTNAVSNGISCPILLDGTIDLSAQDASKDISCTITGKSLDKAKSAKFEQGTSTSITATLTPASDGNSAKFTFKASDFAGKSGTFELFSVDSSGKETNLNQSLKFAVRTPVIDSVTYSQKGATATAVTAGEDLTATIRGSNLDRLAEIDLVDTAAPPNVAKGKVVSPSPVLAKTGEITMTFSAGDIAKLKKPATPPPPAAAPKHGAKPAAAPKAATKPATGGAGAATPAAVSGARLQYTTLDDTTKKESAPAGKDPGVGLP
jgi:hypothetical protein